jgi:hypothetical protein
VPSLVNICAVNAQGTELDISLDIPQFVAYMHSLTVEDFNDFKELKITFDQKIILHNNYKGKPSNQMV